MNHPFTVFAALCDDMGYNSPITLHVDASDADDALHLAGLKACEESGEDMNDEDAIVEFVSTVFVAVAVLPDHAKSLIPL